MPTISNKLKILFAAAEAAPLVKVGGLADVVGALPKALADLGVDVRLILPFYGSIKKNKIKKISGNLWQTNLPGAKIPIYLIKHKLFSGKKIYAGSLADSDKDVKKFLTFSALIPSALKAANFQPDLIHLNDWHTAAVAGQKGHKTILTIHNLAHQGIFNQRNLLAEGILKADAITTVSPTYAKEILNKHYGCGLEKTLKRRHRQLYGILNGLDTEVFNPQTDHFIFRHYSADSPEKKIANKLALLKKLGWAEGKNTALAGLVTRLVEQKGVDLLTDRFAGLNCRFVILGTGDRKYERHFLALSKKFPDKFKVFLKFDAKLAQQIYAASDIFLVPSRFEPCGLTQLIAMRYGAVPVVRKTGGLIDTVSRRTGFSFKNVDAGDFYETLSRALKIYYQKPKAWRRLQLNGMGQDFSWKKSAKKYLLLYKKLIS